MCPRRASGSGASGSGASASAVSLLQRDVVRTGTMSVTVADVDRAASAASALAVAAGGRVDGDNRDTSAEARSAELVLRVPPARLDAVISQIDALGKETSRSVKADDVTASKADIDARTTALSASVSRILQFMRKASDARDLISLESELTTRQAQLDSLQAQQRALGDEISLATLTVDLSVKPAPEIVARHSSGPSGFGTALAGGWHGLVVSVRWVLAGVGYGLPIAVIVSVLATAALLIWRRREQGAPPVSPPVTE